MKYLAIIIVILFTSCVKSNNSPDKAITAIRLLLPSIVDSVVVVRTPDFIAKTVLIRISSLTKNDSIKSVQINDSQKLMAAITLTNKQLTDRVIAAETNIKKLTDSIAGHNKTITALKTEIASVKTIANNAAIEAAKRDKISGLPGNIIWARRTDGSYVAQLDTAFANPVYRAITQIGVIKKQLDQLVKAPL